MMEQALEVPVQAADGDLYGVTSDGGDYSGNIFKLSVPMSPTMGQPTFCNATVNLTWTAVAGQLTRLSIALISIRRFGAR